MGTVNTTKITSKVKKTFEGHNGSNRLFESGESMFDSGRSVERNKMRVVKTIILNGKSFNVVDFS